MRRVLTWIVLVSIGAAWSWAQSGETGPVQPGNEPPDAVEVEGEQEKFDREGELVEHIGSVVVVTRTIRTLATDMVDHARVLVHDEKQKDLAIGLLAGVFPKPMSDDHRMGLGSGPYARVQTVAELREDLLGCENCEADPSARKEFDRQVKRLGKHPAAVFRIRYERLPRNKPKFLDKLEPIEPLPKEPDYKKKYDDMEDKE